MTGTVCFSSRDIARMAAPLLLEQLLVMLVGMADTVIISYTGEAAVSGVTLVNQFNTVFVFVFFALSSGGAVVISQYLGRRDRENAAFAAGQLLRTATLFSVVMAAVVHLCTGSILKLLFGRVEPAVMAAGECYLRILALSYPFLAVYYAGGAVQRSQGRTQVTMYISLIANLINITGNLLGVFVLKAGVAGVAWPSVLSRLFCAGAVTVLCTKDAAPVYYRRRQIFCRNRQLQRQIFSVAIPNAAESGIFQLVKVALSSLVALFGTYQIAANGVAQSIWCVAALVGDSMGAVYTTVIGRCMGAGEPENAERYFRKLAKSTLAVSAFWNLLVLAATPLFLRFYALEPRTESLVLVLVIIHNCFNAVAFPYSSALSAGLRAAGDVKFPMLVCIGSTIFGRLLLSLLFGLVLDLGVIGVTLAMVCDWSIRAAIFISRFRSGRWKRFRVI